MIRPLRLNAGVVDPSLALFNSFNVFALKKKKKKKSSIAKQQACQAREKVNKRGMHANCSEWARLRAVRADCWRNQTHPLTPHLHTTRHNFEIFSPFIAICNVNIALYSNSSRQLPHEGTDLFGVGGHGQTGVHAELVQLHGTDGQGSTNLNHRAQLLELGVDQRQKSLLKCVTKMDDHGELASIQTVFVFSAKMERNWEKADKKRTSLTWYTLVNCWWFGWKSRSTRKRRMSSNKGACWCASRWTASKRSCSTLESQESWTFCTQLDRPKWMNQSTVRTWISVIWTFRNLKQNKINNNLEQKTWKNNTFSWLHSSWTRSVSSWNHWRSNSILASHLLPLCSARDQNRNNDQ